MIERNGHLRLAWDADAPRRARDNFDRALQNNLEKYPPPPRGGDPVGIMMLCVISSAASALFALWWLL